MKLANRSSTTCGPEHGIDRLLDALQGGRFSICPDSPGSPQIHRQTDGAVAELLPLGRDRDNVRDEQLRHVALVVLMDSDRRVEPALAGADGRLRLDDHERDAVDQQDEIGPLFRSRWRG